MQLRNTAAQIITVNHTRATDNLRETASVRGMLATMPPWQYGSEQHSLPNRWVLGYLAKHNTSFHCGRTNKPSRVPLLEQDRYRIASP